MGVFGVSDTTHSTGGACSQQLPLRANMPWHRRRLPCLEPSPLALHPLPACSSKVKIFVNLETTEKIYTSGEHLCPMDGFVCFHNSHLIRCGGGTGFGALQPLHRAAWSRPACRSHCDPTAQFMVCCDNWPWVLPFPGAAGGWAR